MYFRIYSHCLDYNKNWYAYHDLFFGYPNSNRRQEESTVFQLFPSDVQKVNIADIQDCNGKKPSYCWFNGRGQKAKEVYACHKLFWYIPSGNETAKSKRRMAENLVLRRASTR